MYLAIVGEFEKRHNEQKSTKVDVEAGDRGEFQI